MGEVSFFPKEVRVSNGLIFTIPEKDSLTQNEKGVFTSRCREVRGTGRI